MSCRFSQHDQRASIINAGCCPKNTLFVFRMMGEPGAQYPKKKWRFAKSFTPILHITEMVQASVWMAGGPGVYWMCFVVLEIISNTSADREATHNAGYGLI